MGLALSRIHEVSKAASRDALRVMAEFKYAIDSIEVLDIMGRIAEGVNEISLALIRGSAYVATGIEARFGLARDESIALVTEMVGNNEPRWEGNDRVY